MTIKYHEKSKKWNKKEIGVLEIYVVIEWFVCLMASFIALISVLIELAEQDASKDIACAVYKVIGRVILAAFIYVCLRPLLKVVLKHCLNWEKHFKLRELIERRKKKQKQTKDGVKEYLGDSFEKMSLVGYSVATILSMVFGILACAVLADNSTMAMKYVIINRPLLLLVIAAITATIFVVQILVAIGAAQNDDFVLLIDDEGVLTVVTDGDCDGGGTNE